MAKTVEIFTDGACRGNPGPGGWAAVLRYSEHEKHLKGAELATTNNRMELMGVIMGIKYIKEPCHLVISTDSQYVQRGMTEWIQNWKRRGWKTADKKDVKNVDLWQELDAEAARHEIDWQWVRGHSGHPENELADSLARQAIDELLA